VNGQQLIEWVLHEAAIPSVDEVCVMPGRSRGECWGCPITSCPRQVTPFEVAELDSQTIDKALQKLKNNQIWVGSKSGREVYDRLVAECDNDLSRLPDLVLALLVESRDTFLLNQAVESAKVGNQTVEAAAASVRYLGKDNRQDKNIRKFKELVDAG
jgi:hypothetical protein